MIFKGEDKTYRQKFLLYDRYTVSDDDEVIRRCVEEARKSFDGDVDSIQVKIHMEIV